MNKFDERANEVSKIYDLNKRDCLTYSVLLQHMDSEKYQAQISNKKMAEICDCSMTTIRNSIARLHEKDLIVIIRRDCENGGFMPKVHCLAMEFGGHKRKMDSIDKINHIDFICEVWGEEDTYYYGDDEIVKNYEQARAIRGAINDMEADMGAGVEKEDISSEELLILACVAKLHNANVIEYFIGKVHEGLENISNTPS